MDLSGLNLKRVDMKGLRIQGQGTNRCVYAETESWIGLRKFESERQKNRETDIERHCQRHRDKGTETEKQRQRNKDGKILENI